MFDHVGHYPLQEGIGDVDLALQVPLLEDAVVEAGPRSGVGGDAGVVGLVDGACGVRSVGAAANDDPLGIQEHDGSLEPKGQIDDIAAHEFRVADQFLCRLAVVLFQPQSAAHALETATCAAQTLGSVRPEREMPDFAGVGIGAAPDVAVGVDTAADALAGTPVLAGRPALGLVAGDAGVADTRGPAGDIDTAAQAVAAIAAHSAGAALGQVAAERAAVDDDGRSIRQAEEDTVANRNTTS